MVYLIGIGLMVILLVGGFLLQKYVFKKISKEQVDNAINLTKQLIKVVDIIVKRYSKNKEFGDKFDTITDITLEVVEFIEVTKTYDDNISKKNAAFNTTLLIMQRIGLEFTSEDRQFISDAIDLAVTHLPKTYK